MTDTGVLDSVRHSTHRLHNALSKSIILKSDCIGLVRACYELLFLYEDVEEWMAGLNAQFGSGYTQSRFAKISETQQHAATLLEKCGEFNLSDVTVLAGVLQSQLCSLKWKLSRAFSNFPYDASIQARYDLVRTKLDKEAFPLLKKLQDESCNVAVLVHSLCVKRNQFTLLGPKDWQRHWRDVLSASTMPAVGGMEFASFQADRDVVLRCISAELSELSASLRFNPQHQEYLQQVLHLLGGTQLEPAASSCSGGSVQSAPKTPDRLTLEPTLQPAGSFSSTGSAPDAENAIQVTTPVQGAMPQADTFSPGSAASITHESKQSRESLPLMTPQGMHNAAPPTPGSHASIPSSVGSVASNRPPALASSLGTPRRILQLSDVLMKSPQAVPLTASSPVGHHQTLMVPHPTLDINDRDSIINGEQATRGAAPLKLPTGKQRAGRPGSRGVADGASKLAGLDMTSVSRAAAPWNEQHNACGAADADEKDALNREDDGEDSYDDLTGEEGLFDFEHTLLPLPPLPVSKSQDEALRVMAQSVLAQRPRTRSSTSVLPSPTPSNTTEFFTPATMAYPEALVSPTAHPTPAEPQQDDNHVEPTVQLPPPVVDDTFYTPQDPSERVASWLHSVNLERIPDNRHPARVDDEPRGVNERDCDAATLPPLPFSSPVKPPVARAQTRASSPPQPSVQSSGRIMFLTPVAPKSPEDSEGSHAQPNALPFLTPLPKGRYSTQRGVVAQAASTPPPLHVASPILPSCVPDPITPEPKPAVSRNTSLDVQRDMDSSVVDDTSAAALSPTPHMPPGVRQSAPLLASILTSPRLHKAQATAVVRQSADLSSTVSPRPKHYLRDRLKSMLTSGKNKSSRILPGSHGADKPDVSPITDSSLPAETPRPATISMNETLAAPEKQQPTVSVFEAPAPAEGTQIPPRANVMEAPATKYPPFSGGNIVSAVSSKPRSSFIHQKVPSAMTLSKPSSSSSSGTFIGKKSVSFANDGQAVPFPPKQPTGNTDMMNAETMAMVTHTLHQMNFTVKTAARRKLDGRSALHEAVSSNKEWMVKTLLQTRFLPVDITSENGRTPLHEAVIINSLPIVRLLLEHGASVDAKDQDSVTPMHLVKSPAVAEALLAKKPSLSVGLLPGVDGTDGLVRGTTALHAVVSRASSEPETHAWGSVVSSVVKLGADVNAMDQSGCTPLHLAAANGCISLVRVLLENGADASLLDQVNKTALEMAKNQGGKKTDSLRSSKTWRKRGDCVVQ